MRSTYSLGSPSRGTIEYTERKKSSEGHSRTGGCIGGDERGDEKKAGEKRALTSWIRYREGQVRQRKDNDRGTHSLKTASGGKSKDKERK